MDEIESSWKVLFMTADLWIAVATGTMSVLIAIVPLFAGMRRQWGLKAMLGNREGLPALVGWAGRVQRAHQNLLENAPIFYALVLISHVAGTANESTEFGAIIFFASRLVHFIAYALGVPIVRTAAYTVSLAGLVIIGWQLR